MRVGLELEIATLGELDEIALTRRIVVSQIYGNYDPLGLLLPITIKYKLLLQKLSVLSAGWDDGLGDELVKESKSILRDGAG